MNGYNCIVLIIHVGENMHPILFHRLLNSFIRNNFQLLFFLEIFLYIQSHPFGMLEKYNVIAIKFINKCFHRTAFVSLAYHPF
jgi:hypothetical protein